MSDANSGNLEIFDRIAPDYDTEERARVAGIIADRIRSHVGDARALDAVDYGCGTGLVGLRLLDVFRSVLFVDASPQMVAQIRKKIEAESLETAAVLCGNFLTELPAGLEADYVILSQVLLHIRDVDALFPPLLRLLRPGGHALLIDFDRNDRVVSDLVHSGFDQVWLAQRVKAAGFSSAYGETFYRGENLFMGQDASLFLLDARK